MNGLETDELRAAHAKALAVELTDTKRALAQAEDNLKNARGAVDRAQHEERIERLRDAIGAVEDQLRAFGGQAPHKRAAKRATRGQETR